MLVQQELDKFGKFIVQQSKSNLAKKKKKDTGELYNSIGYELKVSKNSFQLSFTMADYWEFIDRGVKGVGGSKADGSSWKMKTVTSSPFKYTSLKPPTKALDGWVLRKGFVGRNAKGQMQSRASVKFAVATSIFHTGIETTNFFTKPFEQAFNKLSDDLVTAYNLDLDIFLKYTLK
jgi:hypothetical protein